MMMKNKISGLLLLSLMAGSVGQVEAMDRLKKGFSNVFKSKTNASQAVSANQQVSSAAAMNGGSGGGASVPLAGPQKTGIGAGVASFGRAIKNTFSFSKPKLTNQQGASLGSPALVGDAPAQVSTNATAPASSPSAGAKIRVGGFFTKKAVDLKMRSAAVQNSVSALSGRLAPQAQEQTRLKIASDRATQAQQALSQAQLAFNEAKKIAGKNMFGIQRSTEQLEQARITLKDAQAAANQAKANESAEIKVAAKFTKQAEKEALASISQAQKDLKTNMARQTKTKNAIDLLGQQIDAKQKAKAQAAVDGNKDLINKLEVEIAALDTRKKQQSQNLSELDTQANIFRQSISGLASASDSIKSALEKTAALKAKNTKAEKAQAAEEKAKAAQNAAEAKAAAIANERDRAKEAALTKSAAKQDREDVVNGLTQQLFGDSKFTAKDFANKQKEIENQIQGMSTAQQSLIKNSDLVDPAQKGAANSANLTAVNTIANETALLRKKQEQLELLQQLKTGKKATLNDEDFTTAGVSKIDVKFEKSGPGKNQRAATGVGGLIRRLAVKAGITDTSVMYKNKTAAEIDAAKKPAAPASDAPPTQEADGAAAAPAPTPALDGI